MPFIHENVKVELFPGTPSPIVYLSESDVGDTIVFELVYKGQPVNVPSGSVVKFNGTKKDGLGFMVNSSNVSGNVVSFVVSQDMTSCSGVVEAEISITLSNNKHGTCNVVLIVEKNPHSDGTQDGSYPQIISEMRELVNQIEGDAETASNAADVAVAAKNSSMEIQQDVHQYTASAINDWLDEHPEATTTVQDGALTESKFSDLLKLKAIKDYVTPEMFGAKGDGVTDDTQPIQSALDSGHSVVFANKYAVSASLLITKDISVICLEESEILPLANIGSLIAVGTGTVTPIEPVLSGLIKVTWHGGKINCKNGNYTADIGLELGKLYHSKFADISVINVTNIGVKYSGSYGSLAICENVAVKGVSGTLAEIGFDLWRNDQRLYNCSAIDCKVGFYIRQGYTRLTGCAAWVSHSNNWDLTIAYVVDANDCSLVECTCDTVKTGVLFSQKAKTCAVTNMFWLCNTGVVSDYTGMRLFVGNDSDNYVSVNCMVVGLQVQAYTKLVYLKTYIADDNNFQILGIAAPDLSYVVDANTVINLSSINNKSKIIGDFYYANMETGSISAGGALSKSMVVPAGKYVFEFNPPYIMGLPEGGSACRLRINGAGRNYHYLKNGWNDGFAEILILSEESTIYVESTSALTHQNNSGSGIIAIRIS